MEVREVTQYDERAPFTGYGVWIVFEQKNRRALLLHPVTLTELSLTEYQFVQGVGKSLWPINTSKSSFNSDRFIYNFKERIRAFLINIRTFPVNLAAQVISEFERISVEEAMKVISSLGASVDEELPATAILDKTNRAYRVAKNVRLSDFVGRTLAVLEVVKESGPVNTYQIASLAEGRLKTKCQGGVSRAVTYIVNKLASQGILEIVT